MQTLPEFYEFMHEVHMLRRAVTSYYLMQAHNPRHIRSLEKAVQAIDGLPTADDPAAQGGAATTGPAAARDRAAGSSTPSVMKRLRAGDREVTVTLDYERGELEKDIFFLGHADAEFEAFLADRSESDFPGEVAGAAQFIRSFSPDLVISDRDGTVNNYCGRYRSSHQSIWNAVHLTKFARAVPAHLVLLTSAPLREHGLLDLSAMPAATVHYAGSKGREYHDRDGNEAAMEIDPSQVQLLERLNERLSRLLDRDEYAAFAVIGSGVQHKHGETTIARQDIHGSIPEQVSRGFLEEVRGLVTELDPGGEALRVNDTGKDVEVTLTTAGGEEFTKGQGVGFLDETLELHIAERKVMVCGDTWSDLPMVEEATRRAGAASTAAIFVTRDADLEEAVRATGVDMHVVSEPDALVTALRAVARDAAGGEGG